jgi:O-antigen/teichoic acid export membrane protein
LPSVSPNLSDPAASDREAAGVAPRSSPDARANLAWYAFPRVLVKGWSILLLPVYTRVLSPADMGVAMLALAVSGALSLVVAPGIDAAYFRWAYAPQPDAGVRSRRAATVVVLHGALLIGGSTLLLLFAAPLGRWLLPGIPAWPYYYVILATAVLASLMIPMQTAWRAERNARNVAALEFAHGALAATTVLICVVVLRLGAISLLLGELAAKVLLLPWYIAHPIQMARGGWDRSLIANVAPYALVGFPVAFAAWALSALDRILLNWFRGAAVLGVYAAGYQVAAGLTAVVVILNKEWQPLMYFLAQPEQPRQPLQRFWTRSLHVFLAFGGLLALLSSFIVRWGFGDAYVASAPLVPLVAMLAVLRVPRTLLYHLSIACGVTRDLAIESALAVAVFVIAGVALIPPYGAAGAAWAGIVSALASLVYLFSRGWNRFHVEPATLAWAGVALAGALVGYFAAGTVPAVAAACVLGPVCMREGWRYARFLGTVGGQAAA